MIYIQQRQIENIKKLMTPGKVVVLCGSRRTGKTTLLKKFVETEKDTPILYINAEDEEERKSLDRESSLRPPDISNNYKVLVIDEAQEISQLELKLKLIMDDVRELKIIVSESYAHDLTCEKEDALTEKKIILNQYPLAELEIAKVKELEEEGNSLESRLIYGSYPEVILMPNKYLNLKEEYLREYAKHVLFRDIVELENLMYTNKLERLLEYLALRVGKDIDIVALVRDLEIKKDTAEHYLNLLEMVFYIYRLNGLKGISSGEVVRNRRYYFYDNGIRNAVIRNFDPVEKRDDINQLWENYIITERLKRQEYMLQRGKTCFWRTEDKEEIDMIEEVDGRLHGYDMKWTPAAVKPPAEWLKSYPEAQFTVIHRDNYLKFIL